MKYGELSRAELEKLHAEVSNEYAGYKARGLSLDMSRGKPDKLQLDLSQAMLGCVKEPEDCLSETGLDCRNYGLLDGIPEAKRIFSELLGVKTDMLVVCGNSSLNIMYDMLVRCMLYGAQEGSAPWSKLPKVKFLCPCPGYDRHFAICESLGIEMIPVKMTPTGPDMDEVERLAASDDSVKGIWCVPKYSNPDGITYSQSTVKRFGALKTAAPDFRIFWDNAYIVHDLYEETDVLVNIFDCLSEENSDKVYEFASTSKITFPGSGVSVIASSKKNIERLKSQMSIQTIGCDKINMLRHVKYFGDCNGIKEHMKKHAELIRPKFDAILAKFDSELSGLGIAEWTKPRGGYFISLNVMPGCAARVWKLMKDAGVTMTSAGAAFPYGKDPDDSNLRIAPTYPPLSEIKTAADVLVCCVKLAVLEKLLAGKD